VEAAVGVVLVVAVAALGTYFSFRPGATPVDRWLLRPVPSTHVGWFTAVTWLRYPLVTVVGAVVAAAVVFRRDRPRALACLIGPPLALLTSELVAKPAVGRTLGGVYSYPSGSVVGAAALATVAVLAAPVRWRPLTTIVAVVFALWMAVAVVTLHWHFPTDALAGLAYGVGVVLVADGVARMLAARWPGPKGWRSLRHRHKPHPGSDFNDPAQGPAPLS
jgi:undecaprenyl-diphosphatase